MWKLNWLLLLVAFITGAFNGTPAFAFDVESAHAGQKFNFQPRAPLVPTTIRPKDIQFIDLNCKTDIGWFYSHKKCTWKQTVHATYGMKLGGAASYIGAKPTPLRMWIDSGIKQAISNGNLLLWLISFGLVLWTGLRVIKAYRQPLLLSNRSETITAFLAASSLTMVCALLLGTAVVSIVSAGILFAFGVGMFVIVFSRIEKMN